MTTLLLDHKPHATEYLPFHSIQEDVLFMQASSQDLLTIFVMFGCAGLLTYNIIKILNVPVSTNLMIQHQKGDITFENNKLTSGSGNNFTVTESKNSLSQISSSLKDCSTAGTWTAAAKLGGTLLLIGFELAHIIDIRFKVLPSQTYVSIYKSCIMPIIFFPIVLSDIMCILISSNMSKLYQRLTVMRKHCDDIDCYHLEDQFQIVSQGSNGGIIQPSNVRKMQPAETMQLFNADNDALGIIRSIEMAIRFVFFIAAIISVVLELIVFFLASFGGIEWNTMIKMTLAQTILLGLVSLGLKLASWKGLMSAMGFELQLRYPAAMVKSHIDTNVHIAMTYVALRLMSYIGSQQMVKSYSTRLEEFSSFQRIDGECIIFFLVFDTAAIVAGINWLCYNYMNSEPLPSMNKDKLYLAGSGSGVSLIHPKASLIMTPPVMNNRRCSNQRYDSLVDSRSSVLSAMENNAYIGVQFVDSLAGRLMMVEQHSSKIQLHVVRRFISSKQILTQRDLNTAQYLLFQIYDNYAPLARKLMLPVSKVAFGRVQDEIWIFYQWPGEDWHTPAYWFCECERTGDTELTFAVIIAIIKALGKLDEYGASHGYIDPNCSIIMRQKRNENGSIYFDVNFMDWGTDALDALQVTTFATQTDIRWYTKTAPHAPESHRYLMMTGNHSSIYNTGFRWIAPEGLFQKCVLQKGISSLTNQKLSIERFSNSSKARRDVYMIGLLLWTLAGHITSNIPSGRICFPYQNIATDEEIIARVVLGGYRPNISQFRGRGGYWGSNSFQDTMKGCLAVRPPKRPAPMAIWRQLKKDLKSDYGLKWPAGKDKVKYDRSSKNRPTSTAKHLSVVGVVS